MALMKSAKPPTLSDDELLLGVRVGKLLDAVSVEELLLEVLLVKLPRGFRGDGGDLDLGLGEESSERNVIVD